MTVIIVQGTARLKPEDMPKLREIAAWMLPATRAEPGCITYTFAEDLLDPGLLVIAERWESEAALQAHFASAHMARFNGALGGLKPEAARVLSYVASDERSLLGE